MSFIDLYIIMLFLVIYIKSIVHKEVDKILFYFWHYYNLLLNFKNELVNSYFEINFLYAYFDN